jgi:hypothetical protein
MADLGALPTMADLGALPTMADLGALPTMADLGALPTITDLGALPTITDLGAVPTMADLGALPTMADLVAILGALPSAHRLKTGLHPQWGIGDDPHQIHVQQHKLLEVARLIDHPHEIEEGGPSPFPCPVRLEEPRVCAFPARSKEGKLGCICRGDLVAAIHLAVDR